MNLPEIFESRRGVEGLHHLGPAAFAGSVVHDGDLRPEGVHQDFGIRRVLSVVKAEQDIDRADAIGRAHQLELFVLGEIAQMDRTEAAVGDETAHRLRILGVVVSGLEARAVRVRSTGAG